MHVTINYFSGKLKTRLSALCVNKLIILCIISFIVVTLNISEIRLCKLFSISVNVTVLEI